MEYIKKTLTELINGDIPDADGDEFRCTYVTEDGKEGVVIDSFPNEGDYKARIVFILKLLRERMELDSD